MHQNIKNAISFAIQEVRNTRYEHNCEESFTDLEVFKMLEKVQTKLQEALDEVF